MPLNGSCLKFCPRAVYIDSLDPVVPQGGRSGRLRLFQPVRADTAHRPPTRMELLELIAEGYFLRRALILVDDAERHGALVRIRPAGAFSTPDIAGRIPDGLADWLATAYAGIRGDLMGFAARTADGTVREGRSADELAAAVRLHPDETLLHVAGICVLDYLGIETGTHVWQPMSAEPEIVVVDVTSVPESSSLAELLSPLPRPSDTESVATAQPLPPVVRIVRFELPTRPGAAAPFEVEDYPTGYVASQHARTLVDGLQPLWLIRLGREELGAVGSGG